MKAKDIKKESKSIESIYEGIKYTAPMIHKYFIYHKIYVSSEVQLQLIEDGFKVYRGDWDGHILNALIIEW